MLRLIATGRPIPKAGLGFEVAEIVGEPEFCDESIKVSSAMRHAGAAAFSYDERFDTLEDVMVAVYRAMEVALLVEDAEATLRRFRDGSDD